MKTKKFLSLLITMMMCLSMVAFPVSATETALTLSNYNVTTSGVYLTFSEAVTSYSISVEDFSKKSYGEVTASENETASVEFTIANNSSDIPATLGEPNITLDKNEWFEVASTYSNANLAVKGQGGDSQTLTLTVKLKKVPTTEEAAAAASETITVSIVAVPASNAN